MDQLSSVATLALATFRLAMMIAEEEGPFSIFVKLRARVGAFDYNEYGQPKSVWGRGISCPLCVGMYAALFFYVLYHIPFGWYIVVLFAIAGLQVLIHALYKGMTDDEEES